SKSPVDHRADIYSLGVVLYEMLTGEIPVGRFPAPSSRAGVDRRLDDIVLKALDRSPEGRYSDTLAFKARLESVHLSKRPNRRLVPFVVAAAAAFALIAGILIMKSIPPEATHLGIDRWNWVNRGDIGETRGTELSLPAYRDRPLMTAAPEGGRLGDRATIRFELLYEINPKDEPWIILRFDGPRADSQTRAIVLFPEGGHRAALAQFEESGHFLIHDLKPLPEGKPSPGRWHKIEASWDGDQGVLALKVDGVAVSEWTLDGIDLSGSWKFVFGGAARSVRIREVIVKNTHKGI
ncbi:MAG TPA: hypothetical protein VFC86_08550, partial [Planctomycetota bacterium]|nr:hypothetical protein [Planctomycetota bacterium]